MFACSKLMINTFVYVCWHTTKRTQHIRIPCYTALSSYTHRMHVSPYRCNKYNKKMTFNTDLFVHPSLFHFIDNPYRVLRLSVVAFCCLCTQILKNYSNQRFNRSQKKVAVLVSHRISKCFVCQNRKTDFQTNEQMNKIFIFRSNEC